MMKYYWYVNADIDKIGSYGNIKPFVKRSISPPMGKPYIIESINGYKHIIKQNDGTSLAELNDMGNISEIRNINDVILNQLEGQMENLIKKKNKEERTLKLEQLENYSTLYSPEEYSMIESLRRGKRIKSRLNRRSPIKKRINKKKK